MKKRTARILTVLAAIVVALGIAYVIAVAVSATSLRRAYAELEKDGRPMQMEDVIPPQIPDSENAALLYQSAILLLKAQPAERDDVLNDLGGLCDSFLKGTIEPNELARLEESIRRDVVTQALSIAQQGTNRPACRFDRQYSAGIQMDLPMSDIRQMARILCTKARFESQAGRPAEAWELLRTQLRFSDALVQEPVIISQLVRCSMIRLSCEAIRAVSETAPPDQQQSRDLMDSLKTFDDIRPLILAMDGDRLLFGQWLLGLPKPELYKVIRKDLFTQDDASDLWYWALFRWIHFRPVFLADHAAYLRATHESLRMVKRPYSPDDRKDLVPPRHILTSMLVPGYSRVKEVYLETIAQIRITRAGLALLQYKRDHGEFPPTLDVLDAKEVADPFVDQPLRYRVEPEGFVLYSVGKDQKDNGGVPQPADSKDKTDFDIVWRFPARSPQ